MDRNILMFYVKFILMFYLLITFFPNVFVNSNNMINYIKSKIFVSFNESKEIEVNISLHKANVIIMFDDGWKSQYDIAYNYMKGKEMRGSIAIISNMIDEIKYINKGNLYQIHNDNWDILNHTYNHNDLKTLPYKKQYLEIKATINWLNKHGFNNNSNILIYPYGNYNNTTKKIMQQEKIISGRTIIEDFNQKIPEDIYDLKVKSILSYTKPTEVYEWIDYAIDENLTLIILFHDLISKPDNSPMEYSIDNFYQIIDYIDQKRKYLNIITLSDWIRVIKQIQDKSI
jgi:peptidoglycan/xylan/chitin deacetylase (PgdA/CDA1 family)